MCGSATLTMVVSRTWISVADMTASVIMRRAVPVGSSAAAAVAILGCLVLGHGDEDAARHTLEERLLLRGAPPAREARAVLVAEDDEVRVDLLRGLGDGVHGVSVLERTLRGHAALTQPLHALLEQCVRALVLALDELGRDPFGDRGGDEALADGEEMRLGLHGDHHVGAGAQRLPALARAVVAEEDLAVHLRNSS